MGTLETSSVGTGNDVLLSWGGRLSYAWFFLPQADIRLDSIYQRIGSAEVDTDIVTFLLQAHVML